MKFDYDLIVIGAGPGGESAALNAAKHELRAAIVDNGEFVGGGCTHKGTIPSKALRAAVSTFMNFSNNPLVNARSHAYTVTYPELLQNISDVVNRQVAMRSRFYSRNQVTVYNGNAHFLDRHSIAVQYNDGSQQTLRARHFIIATGARPYRPPEIDFSHPRVYDSDTILQMQHTPHKILIYGAGVIGCEYASIFSNMGIKVDLINTRERLLEFLDDEISDALGYHLMEKGVIVRHREEFRQLETSDRHVTLHTRSGKRIMADAMLWCNGRTGNTAGLGLENIGLAPNSREQLDVDENYRTAAENIYAVGDVIGWPSLASAAYNQGTSAAATICGVEIYQHVDDVPTGIYTLPEISSVGKTERELTDAHIPYEVGRAFFKDTARGQISGQHEGMLKILFHIDTYELLGIHCFGAEATEIIHIGQAILKQPAPGNDIRYFVNNTFNYPTMAEAYRIAALNGLNRLGV
ncbi:MAG TPA: Si-specific NAD(P)(+) transhydrogenase [Pseudomonadales bacterium]